MLSLSVLDQSPISEGSGMQEALQASISLAVHAERLGFRRYWAAEHHMLNTLASPAPEILLARIAGSTSKIRLGSGGIMLPHYSPLKVAEVFTMLNALAPQRIDLGVGRAPGGGPLESLALRRERSDSPMPDDFGSQLAELLAYLERGFPANHPFARIRMGSATPDASVVWLLGSSQWSAVAAAQLGLPYAFAHFFSGDHTEAALAHYQSHFQPSKHHAHAYSAVAVAVVCAETAQRAELLASSARLMRQRLCGTGMPGPLVPPELAVRELNAPAESPNLWPALVVGTPSRVRQSLTDMAAALKLQELFVVTMTFDPLERLRSYELLADAFDLTRLAAA